MPKNSARPTLDDHMNTAHTIGRRVDRAALCPYTCTSLQAFQAAQANRGAYQQAAYSGPASAETHQAGLLGPRNNIAGSPGWLSAYRHRGQFPGLHPWGSDAPLCAFFMLRAQPSIRLARTYCSRVPFVRAVFQRANGVVATHRVARNGMGA